MDSEWSEGLQLEHEIIMEAASSKGNDEDVVRESMHSESFDLDAALDSFSAPEKHSSANVSSVQAHIHNMPPSPHQKSSYTNRSPVRSQTSGVSTGSSIWSSSRTGSTEELIEHHEQVWAILPTLEELHWSDFPWPVFKRPLSAEDITYAGISAYFHSQNHPDNDKSVKDRIKYYIRRWHPDRVETTLLPRVVEVDKEKVREGAEVVVRNLNELFNSLSVSLSDIAVIKRDVALDVGNSASLASCAVNDPGVTSVANSTWRTPVDIPRPMTSASAAAPRELVRATPSRSTVTSVRRNSTASLQSNESPYHRLVRRTSATSLRTNGSPDYSYSNARPVMLSHQSSLTREEERRRYDDAYTLRKPSASPEVDVTPSRLSLTPARRNSTASLQSNESSSNPYRRARPTLSRQPSFTREEERRLYDDDITSNARRNSIPERHSSRSPARAIPTSRKALAMQEEDAATSRSSLTHVRRNSTASLQSNESSYNVYRRTSPVLSRRSSYTKDSEGWRRNNEVESLHDTVHEREKQLLRSKLSREDISPKSSASPYRSSSSYRGTSTLRRVASKPILSSESARLPVSRSHRYHVSDDESDDEMYGDRTYVRRLPSEEYPYDNFRSMLSSPRHLIPSSPGRQKSVPIEEPITTMEQKASREEELTRREEETKRKEEAARRREVVVTKMELAVRQKAEAVERREEEAKQKAEEVNRKVRRAEEEIKWKTEQIKRREEQLSMKEEEVRRKEEAVMAKERKATHTEEEIQREAETMASRAAVLIQKEQQLQLWEDKLVHQEENLKWYIDARNILTDVCSNKTKCEQLLGLDPSNLQLILDLMQMVLENSYTRANDFENVLLKAMLRVSKRHTLCPRSYILSGVERGEYAIASGHFGEVFQGDYNGYKVSLKVFKLYSSEMSKLSQFIMAFYKEAILWRHLSHRNLLPFYGIYQLGDSGKRICLVSPWMNEGNITQYLERNPQANRRYLTLDIALGISYLHQKSIVHGDLKGVNVLISDTGVACLADFGLSSVIVNTPAGVWSSSTVSTAGTVRWQAPELIGGNDDTGRTKESDIYAFACVCYEVFVGKVPFYEIPNDVTVIHKVMTSGQRPLQPEVYSNPYTKWGLTDWMWTLIEECWSQDPTKRPLASDVVARLSSRNEFLRNDNDGHGDWGDLQPEMFRSLVHQQPTLFKDDIQRCLALLNDL